MEKIINFKNKVLDFIYKYRFIIAVLVLIIGVVLKLHGSSIGLWNNSVFEPDPTKSQTLFGKYRDIRSDEWAVTTPLIFSQKYNNFGYFSNILRGGTTTDAFSLYGLPVANILEIFRPFHLGYIFLGLEMGLSFFWIARAIALFLVTFEFGMILFNKNKRVSLIFSFMISLSPLVGWWFATNGTAEIFIYGELALILLHKYLLIDNFKTRIICLILAVVCAGGYVFILYPAFQIPMFYIFLMLAIYLVWENRKEIRITKKDIISIIVAILIFISLMAYFFVMSKDTINVVLNTVYPGSRVETGGGAFRRYISYIDNVFLPYKEKGLETYTSKEAVMFSLFPLGLIFSIGLMIKNKKLDLFTILLLVPYVIIFLFSSIGLPEFLAKITFLSNSTAQRALMALGFIDILFLLKSLSRYKESPKLWVSTVGALVLSLVLVIICKKLNPNYIGILLAGILFVMCFYLFFFASRFSTKYGEVLFTLGIIGTMIIAGSTINPISLGTNIYDSSIIKSAMEINNNDEGIWLADALPFPCQNYLEMGGCQVINATNIYPNLDLWRSLDKENKFEEVYNRYAHVYMEIKNQENIENKFVLASKDSIQVFVTPSELKDMNIKYIFTVRVMEDFENENISFDLIYNENNYHIYKVNYKISE